MKNITFFDILLSISYIIIFILYCYSIYLYPYILLGIMIIYLSILMLKGNY